MNIQIFGTSKSFDTKKALRYFSDRRIPVQYSDLSQRPLSRGEFDRIRTAVGGCAKMLDERCRDRDLLMLFRYLTDEAKVEKMFENQILLATPIVRNGKAATVGYQPQIWKTWES